MGMQPDPSGWTAGTTHIASGVGGRLACFGRVAEWAQSPRTWAVASVWLLWATLATGLVVGALGAIDYFGIQHVGSSHVAPRGKTSPDRPAPTYRA